MTLHCTGPRQGRTHFGLSHNLDAPSEETGYLFVHLFGASMGITWTR